MNMNYETKISKDASYEEVIAALTEYMEKNNLKQSHLGRLMGMPRGTISRFMRNCYEGTLDSLMTKAIDFLNMEVDIQGCPEEQFVETVQARRVFSACRFAQRKGLLALIIGPAGTGKTTALEAYTRKMSLSVMATAYPGIPPYILLKRIMGKLKFTDAGDDGSLIEILISRLRDTNSLIIVDEGHYLKLNILEKLRHVHDMTGVGMVFSGNFGLHERMRGKEQVKYAHLYSRAAMRVRVDGDVVKKELQDIMEKRGLPMDKPVLDFMYEKAQSPGHFRIVRNLIEIASEIADMNDEDICLKHLREAETLVMEN